MSFYWDLITALEQVQHTRLLSKVAVKIALGKHQLTQDLRDTGGTVIPSGSGFSAAWLSLPTWQAHLPSGYSQLAQTLINGKRKLTQQGLRHICEFAHTSECYMTLKAITEQGPRPKQEWHP